MVIYYKKNENTIIARWPSLDEHRISNPEDLATFFNEKENYFLEKDEKFIKDGQCALIVQKNEIIVGSNEEICKRLEKALEENLFDNIFREAVERFLKEEYYK